MTEKIEDLSALPSLSFGKNLMIYLPQYLVSIASLAVASHYAFFVEIEYHGQNACYGYKNDQVAQGDYLTGTAPPDDMSDLEDVGFMFDIELKIFFATSVAGVVQIFLMIAVSTLKSKFLNYINSVYHLTDCLSFANLIAMMVTRHRFSGRYCSMDWSAWNDFTD